jgi:hypothetical protein
MEKEQCMFDPFSKHQIGVVMVIEVSRNRSGEERWYWSFGWSRRKVTEPHPSMDAEDLKVKSNGWELVLMGARYKPALSTIFSKMELCFATAKTRASHFPCGVHKLPSPVMSTVAACVVDPS